MLDHARKNFEGYTFQMRTLEAWGATIENDRRGYYTAGGRSGCSTWSRRRARRNGSPPEHRPVVLLIDDTPEIAELLTYALRDRGYDVVSSGFDTAISELAHEHRADARRARLLRV